MGKSLDLVVVGLKESIFWPNHVIEMWGQKWGKAEEFDMVGLKESLFLLNHVIEIWGQKWGRL